MSVLCYHKIDDGCPDWNGIVLPVDLFRTHIEYIKSHYEVVPSAYAERGSRSVSITFDDGYADSYSNALPILEEYETCATFFVSTLRIGSDEEDWCNELSRLLIEGGENQAEVISCGLTMSTESIEMRMEANKQIFQAMLALDVHSRNEEMEHLREWSGAKGRVPRSHFRMLNASELYMLSTSPIVTIGSHTVNHPSLGRLSADDQRFELAESKKAIEAITQCSVTQFAYPFGGLDDYSEETISILKELGYQRAFSTTRHSYQENSSFEIRRKCVGRVGTKELGMLIEGQWKE